MCCGKEMKMLEPNIEEVNFDDHIPVITDTGGGILKIQIGNPLHPAEEDHRILFIYVESIYGNIQYVNMNINIDDEITDPLTTFYYKDDRPKTIYAYCSKHGFIQKEYKGL